MSPARVRPICYAVAVLSCLLAAQSAAAAATGGPALKASLRTALSQFLTSQGPLEHISAVSLRVSVRGGKRAIELPVGTTRYGGGRPISTDTLWAIGSNTKAFTSVMLLQLEAEGVLSIHDRLGAWLPRYRAWRHIRIKHLLDMTSGIRDYTGAPAFLRDYAAAPARRFSPSRLVSYAVGAPLRRGYYYSNTAYVLAQMILEKATSDTYAHQLRIRIAKPLGLRSLLYSATQYPRAVGRRLPAGYFFTSGVPQMRALLGRALPRRNLTYGAGAGAIVSTLRDLATWERALYGGRMLPPKQQRELESLVSQKTGRPVERLTASDPQGYGLGVAQEVSPGHGQPFWFYEGETFGSRVVHFYFPSSGLLIDIAVNSSTDDRKDKLAALATSIVEILENQAG